jgi:hypothetical protein
LTDAEDLAPARAKLDQMSRDFSVLAAERSVVASGRLLKKKTAGPRVRPWKAVPVGRGRS